MSCMKKKKPLTNKQYQKYLIKKCYTTLSVYLFAWHSFCCDMEGDILIMKEKKPSTKFNENATTVLNFVASLLVCAFMLAVIIYSLPL